MAIPLPVRQQLRQDVGYACPICGCPFLTFHHFDPTKGEMRKSNPGGKIYHNPNGMIALCSTCHRSCDPRPPYQPNLSKSQLRSLKNKRWPLEQLKHKFPWEPEKPPLVRLAGNYAGNSRNRLTKVLSFDGKPHIWFSRTEEGMFLLSFILQSRENQIVVKMDDNTFEWNPDLMADMEIDTGPNILKVWFAKGDVGLEIAFHKVTQPHLDTILANDHVTMQSKFLKSLEQADLPLGSIIGDFQTMTYEMNPVLHFVKQWAVANCLNDEGDLALFDFRRLKTTHKGNDFYINDGIGINGNFYGSGSFDNQGVLFNIAVR